MKSSREVIPQTKKEISNYIHELINKGNIETAEKFLLRRLEEGDRSTMVLGSLINIYKRQSGKWQEVEELSKEYLLLKPNNSFAKSALALAKERNREAKEKKHNHHEQAIKEFRRKIYEGKISIDNIPEEQLASFTEFEKTILLAEFYSFENIPNKAVQLLKQAEKQTEITSRERKIVSQALKLANSVKMGPIQRKMQWGYLSGDEGIAK